MDHIAKAQTVISLEIAELQRLHDRVGSAFEEAVELLMACLEGQRKIVVAGVGKSGNVGQKLVATFNSTGAPAVALNCQDALHGDLGLVEEGDVVLALSYTGETSELLALMPHLKRRGVKLIAITGKAQSSLAQHADCLLDIAVEREACPLNLAPTSSTTCTLVMGDALAMVLLEARGFQKENFAQLHPGGSLGHQLLTRAEDIMRSGESLVLVGRDEPITAVIRQMTEARCGAVIVVTAEGKIEGIFSQGDFARAFQENSEAIGGEPVGRYMTASPKTVYKDQLVGEVLHFLEQVAIDDLPVIDAEGYPVGMIDTQDLTRLKLF